jgi:hypothetical protein
MGALEYSGGFVIDAADDQRIAANSAAVVNANISIEA